MSCARIQPLLDAFVDGELDAVLSREVETHIEQCPLCRDQWQQLRALRAAVRDTAPYYRAPPALREDIARRLGADTAADRSRSVRSSRHRAALAASVLIAAALAATGTYWLAHTPQDEWIAKEVVSGHVRSLMVAARVTDVASSDRHAVKPWFNGKLDFAPTVVDLTTDGFPLLGGRLDYLAGRPVAALVYRHRQHLINLFVWPAPGLADVNPRGADHRGYRIVHWTQSEMTYWAVSDVNAESLDRFGSLVRARTPLAETPGNGNREP